MHDPYRRSTDAPSVSSALYTDAAMLVSTAKHLRWLTWYRLITWLGLILLAVLHHLNRRQIPEAFIVGLISAGIIIGYALFGFMLAYFVRRAHLWAVILSLILSVLGLAGSVALMFQTPRWDLPMIVFETAGLIFNLTLVKQLTQSLGAARRVQNAMMPPAEALPAEDEWSRRSQRDDARREAWPR